MKKSILWMLLSVLLIGCGANDLLSYASNGVYYSFPDILHTLDINDDDNLVNNGVDTDISFSEEIFSDNILNNCNYTLEVINSSEIILLNSPHSENVFTFPIVQIIKYNDEFLEKKINNSIIDASIWMSEFLPHVFSASIEIHTKIDRYLSFSYNINLFDVNNPRVRGRNENFFYFITIDMNSGERVMLNDLININLEFTKKILDLNLINYSNNFSFEENSYYLLSQLEAISLTAKEVYEYCNKNDKFSSFMNSLVHRHSFFLEENYIIIVFSFSGGLKLKEIDRIDINIFDIEDFLLVKNWYR